MGSLVKRLSGIPLQHEATFFLFTFSFSFSLSVGAITEKKLSPFWSQIKRFERRVSARDLPGLRAVSELVWPNVQLDN
jgi:hypothetical protein